MFFIPPLLKEVASLRAGGFENTSPLLREKSPAPFKKGGNRRKSFRKGKINSCAYFS
jgi:hypothetical protein